MRLLNFILNAPVQLEIVLVLPLFLREVPLYGMAAERGFPKFFIGCKFSSHWKWCIRRWLKDGLESCTLVEDLKLSQTTCNMALWKNWCRRKKHKLMILDGLSSHGGWVTARVQAKARWKRTKKKLAKKIQPGYICWGCDFKTYMLNICLKVSWPNRHCLISGGWNVSTPNTQINMLCHTVWISPLLQSIIYIWFL